MLAMLAGLDDGASEPMDLSPKVLIGREKHHVKPIMPPRQISAYLHMYTA